jgi:hypothetical protein
VSRHQPGSSQGPASTSARRRRLLPLARRAVLMFDQFSFFIVWGKQQSPTRPCWQSSFVSCQSSVVSCHVRACLSVERACHDVVALSAFTTRQSVALTTRHSASLCTSPHQHLIFSSPHLPSASANSTWMNSSRMHIPNLTPTQKIAVPLTCELTPPGQFAGADEKKKNHLPFSLQVFASFSKSSISPSGIPHRARMYS